MPKRKIEAEVAVDVTGVEKVEKLEKRLGDLQDTEIEVSADTSKLERFEQELDALELDKARELRIEFRAQTLQQNIRSALRDLDRLEDPIEIRTATAGLEEAQRELQDLAELASRKYEVQVDVDPRRNAARAADDVDRLRQRGEGLQSAIPALRGFTDELGAAAQGAGVASQAAADLGDTALILGERFGIGGRAQKALTTFGTALGALGIGGVVVGGVVAGFDLLQRSSEKLRARIEETTQAILGQVGVAEEIAGRYDEAGDAYELFADKLLGDEEDFGKAADALTALGLTIEDLPRLLQALSNGDADALERVVLAASGSDEAADALAELVRSGRDLTSLNWTAAENGLTGFQGASERALAAVRDLVGLTDDLEVDAVAQNLLNAYAVSSDEAKASIQALYDEFGREAPLRVLDAYVRGLDQAREAADEAEPAVDDLGRTVERVSGLWGDFERAGADALGGIVKGAADAVTALDPVAAALSQITNEIDAEQQMLAIADQFDEVQKAAVEAMTAAAEGAEDAEAKARAYRREQLRLTEDVLDYLGTIEDIPLSKVTEIRTALDNNKLVEAERLLAELTGDKFAQVYVDLIPRSGFDSLSFALAAGQAPRQTGVDLGTGTFLSAPITIINPPGTPAATVSNVDLYNKRNGDQSGAL